MEVDTDGTQTGYDVNDNTVLNIDELMKIVNGGNSDAALDGTGQDVADAAPDGMHFTATQKVVRLSSIADEPLVVQFKNRTMTQCWFNR